MRMDICNIIKEMKIPCNSDISTMEIYDCIMNFCKENQTRPRKHTYSINNGCLFIDGKFTKRVGHLDRPAYAFDEETYCAEGRILARQEVYD